MRSTLIGLVLKISPTNPGVLSIRARTVDLVMLQGVLVFQVTELLSPWRAICDLLEFSPRRAAR